jgi:Domain of unknown function (4846)
MPVKNLASTSAVSASAVSASVPSPAIGSTQLALFASEQPASATVPTAPFDRTRYPWLTGATAEDAGRERTLEQRFAPPPGFVRMVAEAEGFAAWLRGLPLAKRGTPVVSFAGDTLVPAGDPRLAAVVDLDIGNRDLQQCADSVIRLHAEWNKLKGQNDAVSYTSFSGVSMPYARWQKGERLGLDGKTLVWRAGGKSDTSHASFRSYLDSVFSYANTVSIARDGKLVSQAELAPGDFVVAPGTPGHAVVVLDVAKNSEGKRVALLGQGYMPAQSFHVLAHDGDPWFSLEGAELATPFWKPFSWSQARRLP